MIFRLENVCLVIAFNQKQNEPYACVKKSDGSGPKDVERGTVVGNKAHNVSQDIQEYKAGEQCGRSKSTAMLNQRQPNNYQRGEQSY